MLRSLPQLASSYLNVQNIWPSTSADEDTYDYNSNSYSSLNLPLYYIDPNMSEEDKVNRLVDSEVNLAQKLSDLPLFYSERLSLSTYFGFGLYSNHPSAFRVHSYIFEQQVKEQSITVKIYADLMVNELREAARYWREHFLLAYHYAFPNPLIIERYGDRLKIVKEGNSTFIVSQDGKVNCMEWKSRFLDDIAPEMKRKLEAARSTIVKTTNRLLEAGELTFFAHCSALEEHKRCSLVVNPQSASKETFFNKDLFDQLSAYSTLTLSKTFEVRKTFR